MKKVIVTTTAEATITETWVLQVPDDWDLEDPEIGSELEKRLGDSQHSKFIAEAVDDNSEKDRQIMSWQHGKVVHSYDCYDTFGPRTVDRCEMP